MVDLYPVEDIATYVRRAAPNAEANVADYDKSILSATSKKTGQ